MDRGPSLATDRDGDTREGTRDSARDRTRDNARDRAGRRAPSTSGTPKETLHASARETAGEGHSAPASASKPETAAGAGRALKPLDKPDLYVVARFLDRLGRPGKTYSRNQLQMAVRLNYDLYRRYLAFLLDKGFVVVRPGADGETVHLTPAGVAAQRALVEWIRGVLGDRVL